MKLLISFLLLCAAAAQAGTVVFGTTGGRALQRADGTALPAGCAFFIGTFNPPAADRDATLAATGDYATLKGWFTPLAAGGGTGVASQPGTLGGGLRTNDYPAAGDSFALIAQISSAVLPAGTPLYLWVFDAATPETAQQWGIYTADAWAAPPALGASSLGTGGGSGVRGIQGSVTTGGLRLAGIPASFGNWSWQSFGLDAPASVAGSAADPDADGIPNLGEYAWGLDARSRDVLPMPVWDSAGGTMIFQYRRPRLLGDVSVVAEISTDLATWTPVAGTVTAATTGYDTLTVTPVDAARCFWRVRFDPVSP